MSCRRSHYIHWLQEMRRKISELELKADGLGSVDSSRGFVYLPYPEGSLRIPLSLSIDQNNSLALMPRNSIEHFIPIPRGMLSQSIDLYAPRQVQEAESVDDEAPVKVQISDKERDWLIESLKLNELFPAQQQRTSNVSSARVQASNTKNVLRNIGNAQNQYALYHKKAKQFIEEQLGNPQKFRNWVRKLRMEKFEHFKEVWMNEPNAAFRRVYKQLCYTFYVETAIPYILASRMKNDATKFSHLKYLYRFLEGLQNPQDFAYFKKQEK